MYYISRLLDKLHGQFGIDGELYAWMDSYLSNRKQFTTINGKESSKMYVRCGVPQGSVLGPTLFTLYTNDLPSFMKSGGTFMYADDTTVFCTGSSQDVACNLLNCALEELFTWCVNNHLTPHPGKCKVLLLSKARLIVSLPTIYIGKSIIEYKATARLLGVTLDQNLSWIPHLKDVIKNFANKFSLLKKSKFLPGHVCESLYVKVIQPSITYTMPVWGGVNQTELFKTLERQHCHAARIIFGFPPDMPTVDVLATVKWNTLTYMYKRSLIKQFLKGYCGMLPGTLVEELIIHADRPSSLLKHGLIVTSFASKIRSKLHFLHRGCPLFYSHDIKQPEGYTQ